MIKKSINESQERESWSISRCSIFSRILLLAQALQLTSASHAVVLLYTAPIFVALGLHWKLPSERLTLLQWTGIGIAFIGIVVTFIRPQQIGVNTFQQQMLWEIYTP